MLRFIWIGADAAAVLARFWQGADIDEKGTLKATKHDKYEYIAG
jgi:hypothetical protein